MFWVLASIPNCGVLLHGRRRHGTRNKVAEWDQFIRAANPATPISHRDTACCAAWRDGVGTHRSTRGIMHMANVSGETEGDILTAEQARLH